MPEFYQYKSSNESVATVNKNGLVTIHKNGSSVITAQSSNGIKAEMQIVPAAAVYSFNLNSDKIELTMNYNMAFSYNIINGYTDKCFTR